MKAIVSVMVMAFAALPAWAGPGKAGLWDVTMQMNFTKGGPQIPSMQLDQMERTETDRSAWRTRSRAASPQLDKTKQMGIESPFGKAVTSKVCITPAMAARDEAPRPMREQDGCEMKNYNRNGSAITADMVCNGDMKGTGKLKVNYYTNTSYSGTMDFSGTGPQSGAVEMHNAFSGKWISDSCGSVKPLATK